MDGCNVHSYFDEIEKTIDMYVHVLYITITLFFQIIYKYMNLNYIK